MEPTVKRRLFVSAAAAATVLPAAVRAQTPVTLKIGIIPAEICGQVIYGAEAGYFSRAGLDMQMQTFPSGGAIAAALAGGALDIGMVDLTSMINAHVRGIPFVALAPGLVNSSEAPTFAIVVRGDSDIRSAKDLNGKSIGVNGLNNIAQVSAMAWIDNNGGNSKAVKFVELPLPAKAAAIKAGTIDASLDTEPFLTYGLDQGFRAFYMEVKPIASPYLLDVFASTREWAQKNSAAAAKFISAMHDTSVWANANHQLTAPMLAKATRLPLEVVQRMRRGAFAVNEDPKLVQPVIDAVVRYGIIAKGFPASELMYKGPA
jgi:NitT/TauT family transport system substrate-binding protein